jgi:hypothetical protein
MHRRRQIREFYDHQFGNEFLGSQDIKLDGGTLVIGFGNDPETVTIMPDVLAFR